MTTLSELSDKIHTLKEEEKALRNEADALKTERAGYEAKLAEEAAKQGLKKGGGEASTFNIELETFPHVVDWDEFQKYIAENGWFHLLQRRPAIKAAQELWERGMQIPGVEKFTKIVVTVKGV